MRSAPHLSVILIDTKYFVAFFIEILVITAGETEMKITEIRKPITTWLQLSDSRNNCTNWGDMMFSLSYLPTAER